MSDLQTVWPAQNSHVNGTYSGKLTSYAICFELSPLPEEPDWHQRSRAKAVCWMLTTFSLPWSTNLGIRSHHVPPLIPEPAPAPRARSWVWTPGAKSYPSTCSHSNTGLRDPRCPHVSAAWGSVTYFVQPKVPTVRKKLYFWYLGKSFGPLPFLCIKSKIKICTFFFPQLMGVFESENLIKLKLGLFFKGIYFLK